MKDLHNWNNIFKKIILFENGGQNNFLKCTIMQIYVISEKTMESI